MAIDITFSLAKVKSFVHLGRSRVHYNKLSSDRFSPHSHKYVWSFLVSLFNYVCIRKNKHPSDHVIYW